SFLQWHSNNSASSYRDNINYINIRGNFKGVLYNNRRALKVENEYSPFFNRLNLNYKNTGYAAILRMITNLYGMNNNIDNSMLFKFHHVVNLIISPTLYRDFDFKLKLRKGFESSFRVKGQDEKPRFSKKDNFINWLLYDYCHTLASYFLASDSL